MAICQEQHFQTTIKVVLFNKKGLMKKICKFDKLDTIRLNSQADGDISEESFEALAFVISKLPNLRELSIEFQRYNYWIPIEEILKVFDSLLKASSLEILRLGIQTVTERVESLITHPGFKAKSLKRVHLSFPEVIETMHLLRNIPMLYELSLCLASKGRGQEIPVKIIEEIAKMTNLRKLEVQFPQLSEKQAGDILRSLSKMSLLEELSLFFSLCRVDSGGNYTALSQRDEVEELPKLQKAKFILREYDYSSDRIMLEMAEFFGKCLRLREMKFDVEDCKVASWEILSQKLLESWGKLKCLQDLELNLRTFGKEERNNNKQRVDLITMPMFVNWMRVFDRMECLQDVYISKGYYENEGEREVDESLWMEALRNPKYRFFKIHNL